MPAEDVRHPAVGEIGLSPFRQGTFVGTFIVVAVAFDGVRKRRRTVAA